MPSALSATDVDVPLAAAAVSSTLAGPRVPVGAALAPSVLPAPSAPTPTFVPAQHYHGSTPPRTATPASAAPTPSCCPAPGTPLQLQAAKASFAHTHTALPSPLSPGPALAQSPHPATPLQAAPAIHSEVLLPVRASPCKAAPAAEKQPFSPQQPFLVERGKCYILCMAGLEKVVKVEEELSPGTFRVTTYACTNHKNGLRFSMDGNMTVTAAALDQRQPGFYMSQGLAPAEVRSRFKRQLEAGGKLSAAAAFSGSGRAGVRTSDVQLFGAEAVKPSRFKYPKLLKKLQEDYRFSNSEEELKMVCTEFGGDESAVVHAICALIPQVR